MCVTIVFIVLLVKYFYFKTHDKKHWKQNQDHS